MMNYSVGGTKCKQASGAQATDLSLLCVTGAELYFALLHCTDWLTVVAILPAFVL